MCIFRLRFPTCLIHKNKLHLKMLIFSPVQTLHRYNAIAPSNSHFSWSHKYSRTIIQLLLFGVLSTCCFGQAQMSIWQVQNASGDLISPHHSEGEHEATLWDCGHEYYVNHDEVEVTHDVIIHILNEGDEPLVINELAFTTIGSNYSLVSGPTAFPISIDPNHEMEIVVRYSTLVPYSESKGILFISSNVSTSDDCTIEFNSGCDAPCRNLVIVQASCETITVFADDFNCIRCGADCSHNQMSLSPDGESSQTLDFSCGETVVYLSNRSNINCTITIECCSGISEITAPKAIVIDKLCCNETNDVDGSIFEAPPCPAGSTIQYSTDGINFSNNLPLYDQTASVTVYTRCDCDCSDASVSEVSTVTTAPGESCCPDLSTPPTIEITNSTCDVFGGELLGGIITYGTCPEGSSIMYSFDGETYSVTPITYDQGNPVTVYVRCECGNEIGQPNAVTTIPGICPDPYFGVTNNFEAADPCICNGDQGDNNQAGDGTFNETVTVTGPTGLMVRVATETNGAITANTLMTESPAMSGSYILNFDHQDRLGFNITLFEWSADGGATWTTATDASSTVVMISNVCAYPVLSSTLEPTTCNIYGGLDLVTVLSLNATIDNPSPLYTPTIPAGLSFTIDGVAATILDPSSLAIGVHTLVTTYTYDNGLGDGGTSANPSIGLDNINCPVVYTQTFEIAECEPIPTMGEWGLIILGLLLLIFGVVTIKSRQIQQPIYSTKHV